MIQQSLATSGAFLLLTIGKTNIFSTITLLHHPHNYFFIPFSNRISFFYIVVHTNPYLCTIIKVRYGIQTN